MGLPDSHMERAISRSRGMPKSNADRKIDLMAKELRRYRVSVAGIQETKWFGSDMWEADGYLFLHCGHPLPGEDDAAVQNEGVGIALHERAARVWKEAGEVWKAVSSRIVTARLKVSSVGQRRPDDSRLTRSMFATVISVYAPTAKAPPSIAQNLADDLQDSVDAATATDVMIVLGDFNARVGSSSVDDSLWQGVRGRHGIGECNAAGERLLEFCAVNQLTVLNNEYLVPEEAPSPNYMEAPSHQAMDYD